MLCVARIDLIALSPADFFDTMGKIAAKGAVLYIAETDETIDWKDGTPVDAAASVLAFQKAFDRQRTAKGREALLKKGHSGPQRKLTEHQIKKLNLRRIWHYDVHKSVGDIVGELQKAGFRVSESTLRRTLGPRSGLDPQK